jgi:hypothetical protein
MDLAKFEELVTFERMQSWRVEQYLGGRRHWSWVMIGRKGVDEGYVRVSLRYWDIQVVK